MAPTAIVHWEPFPVESSSTPPLYLQRSFTQTSYAIYLTDLSSIWGETLDKSGICDRADDRNCSIDPSTDDSQLQILLDKLNSGVTGLCAAVTVDLEIRGDTVIVTTNEKLQAPLQPLEWRFRLKLQPATEFTARFSLPLLYYGSLLSRQTSSLLTVIEEKDAAIARLLDRFEEYKIDIGNVFPGYKKDRAPTGRAKGIAKFDKDEWRQDVLRADIDTKVSRELVETTFNHIPYKDTKLEVDLPRPPASQWWTKLKWKVTVKGEPKAEPTPHTTPRKPPKPVRLNTDSDDDFEAFNSPSHPRVKELPVTNESISKKRPIDDESTEDEDDLDNTLKSQNSRTASNKSSQQATPPLGTSRRSLRDSAALSVSPEPVKRETSDSTRFETNFGNQMDFIVALVESGEATTSGSDTELSKLPRPTLTKTSKVKKTIGGRKQQRRPVTSSTPDPDEGNPARAQENEVTLEHPKRLGKIKGTIGGRKPGAEPLKQKGLEPDSDEEMVDPEQEAPQPPPKKKEKTKSPPIQGMDEDAAQRRRDELQKQLAAKAAGKKKARKF
ncbi:hypothetical protein DRE_01445 [Drechslerella stenobrocha 248]|uniref:Non-homologous end-joining factor 1 n=1 Tax=Drechslerella stenobrocha 248 TaxID=1043628 RepID=W7HUQ2_9PEZI|nr:hypothetical protein DRE_01445 [Drechslerella stenobrocha 248]